MARSRSASSSVLRRTVTTAWIALLVPIIGVALAVVVGRSDADLSSSDPIVTLAFLGGAAIGLALWVVGVSSLLRRPLGRGAPKLSPWLLVAAWPVAIVVAIVVNLVFNNGGAAAGVGTVVALGWWWGCWSRAAPHAVASELEGPD